MRLPIQKTKQVKPHGFFIQARKISAMRTLAGMRRSMDISIKGKPNHFDIKLSTGEWGKNLISSAPLMVPALITGIGTKDTNQTASLISMGVGVASLFAKMYTARRAENNTWKYIKDQVKILTNFTQKRTCRRSNHSNRFHGI